MKKNADARFLDGVNTHRWGCCIRGYDFLYVYGEMGDYLAFCQQDSDLWGHTLHKGRGASLVEVQACAEEAAARLLPIYEDIGSVRVTNARNLLRQCGEWPPPMKRYPVRPPPRPKRVRNRKKEQGV